MLLEIGSDHLYEDEPGWHTQEHLHEASTTDVFEDISIIPRAPHIERPERTIGQGAHVPNFYVGPKKMEMLRQLGGDAT